MEGFSLLLWSWALLAVGFLAGASWCALKTGDKVHSLEELVHAMRKKIALLELENRNKDSE